MEKQSKGKAQLKVELDKVSIDQLHKAVLQFSNNCFEIKKLCATVLVATATLVATLLGKALDTSLFVTGGVVAVVFWVLDAQNYYYQEKLRARMKRLAEILDSHGGSAGVIEGVGMPLSEDRENWVPGRRALHALFNMSMLFYALVAVLVLIGFLLFRSGVISTPVQGEKGVRIEVGRL